MTTYQFIFSDEKTTRFLRHLGFWIVYGILFCLHSISPKELSLLHHPNILFSAFTSLYIFLPASLISVYVFLYFPAPHYFLRKKYFQFIISVILLYIFFTIINRYLAIIYFKKTCNCDVNDLKPLYIFSYGNNNALLSIATGFVAAIIKFTKEYYKKQREIFELSTQKINAELQILKTSIQPVFLFHSLKSLQSHIQISSQKSPEMVLRFSEILSYLLYECDGPVVPLRKELAAVDKFLFFEKIRMHNNALIYVHHEDSTENKFIVPSLLLLFFQNCFIQLYEEDAQEIFVEIITEVKGEKLQVLFTVIQTAEEKMNIDWKVVISKTHNLLNQFYEHHYFLKIKKDQEKVTLMLRIDLNDGIKPDILIPVKSKNKPEYETV